MSHRAKTYIAWGALDAVLLSFIYIVILPTHSDQSTQWTETFLAFNAAIAALTFALKPIQMVDMTRQREEVPQQIVTHSAPKYNPSVCEECRTPIGKARFCPNCGTPVTGVGPRQISPNLQQQTGFALTRRMVEVEIEGTALVPQEDLQELKITKVKMGKQIIQNGKSTEEEPVSRPIRNKKVKPIPVAQPPIPPVDNSPQERDIYEDPMPQRS